MVRPNIGIVNAMIRIACGLTLLSWSTIKYCKAPRRDSLLVVMSLAGLKVASGILQFCPVTFLSQNQYCFNDDDYDDDDLMYEYEEDDEVPIPSPS
ncbi:DUF2892 domain-containing protein [Metabacillus fastidiosus]|uniref:YgaP family membrane protein n=1 Tax=Metabacillus fastidiosus TaxID=1458 RepID=UPI003D2937AF